MPLKTLFTLNSVKRSLIQSAHTFHLSERLYCLQAPFKSRSTHLSFTFHPFICCWRLWDCVQSQASFIHVNWNHKPAAKGFKRKQCGYFDVHHMASVCGAPQQCGPGAQLNQLNWIYELYFLSKTFQLVHCNQLYTVFVWCYSVKKSGK